MGLSMVDGHAITAYGDTMADITSQIAYGGCQ
jgi:hypothetical protein